MSRAAGHPDEMELALFAGGDLPFWRRWSIGRHVTGCAVCRSEVEQQRASSAYLVDEAGEMPAGISWPRLSAEMRANVRLGLEIGAIAGPVSEPARPMGWRVAAACACALVLAVSGWWLHLPQPSLRTLPEAAAVQPRVLLKTTSTGIELAENGLSMALVHHGEEKATLRAGMQGELSARYVDDDTGEVTIHHVYSE